jgi:signal transduction histidine kinase
MTWSKTDLKRALPNVLSKISHQSLYFTEHLKCTFASQQGSSNVFRLDAQSMLGKSIDDFSISDESKALFKNKCMELQPNEAAVQLVLPESAGEVEHWIMKLKQDNNIQYQVHSITKRSNTLLLEQMDQLFRFRSEAVAMVNRAAEIIYINRPFLGWPVETAKGRNIASLFSTIDKHRILQAIEETHDSKVGKSMNVSVSFLQKVQSFRLEVSAIDMDEGGVMLQFHNQLPQENENLKTDDKLDLLERILGGMDTAVFAVGPSGKLLFSNASAENLFERRFKNVIEFTHVTGGRWLKNDNKTPVNLFDLPFTQEADQVDEAVEFEYFYLKSDEALPLEVSCSKIPLGNKEAILVWHFRIIQEAYRARKKMEEANANLDDFVRATAHDLRSPISNMKNLFNLLDKIEESAKKGFVLDKIKDSVFKLDDLLNGLMQMVDAQNNKHLMIEKLRFEDVYEFVMNDLEEQVRESNAKITIDFEVETIVYNKAYLRSILYNLISNGIKYRDKNRPLEIKISNRQNNNEVWLKVEDNGLGIDLSKYSGLLFKPFKRLTNQGSGKGIGLSLIKQFVEKNGGQIFVDSEPGEGTAFVCVLIPFPNEVLQTSLF